MPNKDNRLVAGHLIFFFFWNAILRPADQLTQILHVLIGNELGNDLWHISLHTPSKVALVHDNSICHGGGDKGEAIGKDGPRGVVVESDERKRVAEDRKEQCQVSNLWSARSQIDQTLGVRCDDESHRILDRHTRQTKQTCRKENISIQTSSIEASRSFMSSTDRRITYCRVWARALSLSARGRFADGGGAME